MAKYDALLDQHFRALADGTRRQVLTRLARGPATVSELAAPFDMALPSFMAHLGVLEEAGLITTAKVGRVRTCELAPGAFSPAVDWLGEQKALWTERLDALDDYVTKLMKERKR